MKQTLREYCLRYGAQELLDQWHPTKNRDCTPDTLSYGSQKKIWWGCPQGHEWEMPLYARTGKLQGCPYCAGKKIAPGADLAARFPDLASQWHPTKNASHRPEQYLPGSHMSVWWQCAQGHQWRATIKSRTEGSGCPVCANRVAQEGVNDLASENPALAAQWHPTKNGDLTPDQVLAKTQRKVWWQCPQGHQWRASVSSRAAGSDCPVCANKVILPGVNDLETVDPETAAQWHREKNGNLTPSQISVYSNRSVWWRCGRDHEWKAPVSARTFNKTGCPYCANRKVLPGFNDLETREPKVAAQWHPTKNDPLEPSMVTVGSTKRVWWKCSLGHEWRAVIYSRAGTQKSGCPYCAGRKKENH